MVPRYARPEMTAIWSPESRYRIWFEIEAHATDALAELGVVPRAAAKAAEKPVKIRVKKTADKKRDCILRSMPARCRAIRPGQPRFEGPHLFAVFAGLLLGRFAVGSKPGQQLVELDRAENRIKDQ